MSRRATLGRDRGAVLVELAMVVPFLALLLFGAMQVGSAVIADSRVDRAVSDAARRGALAGGQSSADRDVLLALQAALPAQQLARLDRVVIFRAATPDGQPPAACTKPEGSTSEAGATGCNTYTGATVRAVSGSSMAGFGGGPGTKDSSWSPASRADALADPPDYLGVWVRTSHVGVSGLPFSHISVVSEAVFRLQPDVFG
jgi:Flp pilus assembly protein TadG